MSALRLVYSAPRHALEIECVECGALDSEGASGPAYLVAHGGGYGERVDWLCRTCTPIVWGPHSAALAKRRALIAAYREGGWEAVARLGRPDVQLGLFGGAL